MGVLSLFSKGFGTSYGAVPLRFNDLKKRIPLVQSGQASKEHLIKEFRKLKRDIIFLLHKDERLDYYKTRELGGFIGYCNSYIQQIKDIKVVDVKARKREEKKAIALRLKRGRGKRVA